MLTEVCEGRLPLLNQTREVCARQLAKARVVRVLHSVSKVEQYQCPCIVMTSIQLPIPKESFSTS